MKKAFLFFIAFILFACIPASATLVIVAPHPDDAEASCGGLIVNTVAAGEKVIILQMTGGEKGMPGIKAEKARANRAKEAEKSAQFLGVSIVFFGAIDAELDVTIDNTAKLRDILNDLGATVVTAPWPMDVHNDHQATGLLAWRAFLDKQSSFDLYFYETSNPPHTKTFQFVPTHYVDITDAMDKKKEALGMHKSQFPNLWFDMYELIERFRGYESDVKYAEGYIKAREFSGHGGRAPVIGKTLKKGD